MLNDLDPAIYQHAGLAGVVFYLGSYAALQAGLIKGQTFVYAGANLIAASLVLFSLMHAFNLASAAIQISWIVISLVGITRLLFVRWRTRFTAEEQLVVEALVPGLCKVDQRRFLKLGTWQRLINDEPVTRQGSPVRWLALVASGSCTVERDGSRISTVREGSTVGEMTYLTGEPATATVRASGPVRLFCLDAEKLRTMLAANEPIRAELERTLAMTLRERLCEASGDLAKLRKSVARMEYTPVEALTAA